MADMEIKVDLSYALKALGQKYKNAADAIKEHVSNAIDEHIIAKKLGTAVPVCEVVFTLSKDNIMIEYPYGMSKEEFQVTLKNVAKPTKKETEKLLNVKLIGSHGIGIFGFFQAGNKCVFLSKKRQGEETHKIIIRDGYEKAKYEIARKHESLKNPGIKVIISELLMDPTKSKGPLSPAYLQRFFAEKFDAYLRTGFLRIKINLGSVSHNVEPLKIDLPPIAKEYSNWYIKGDESKIIVLELYYDPSGKGKVAIRHRGVVIVDSIAEISDVETYGLKDSIYSKGNLRGFIDADFLETLPTRTGFLENDNWILFLVELDNMQPMIEAEIDIYQEEAKKKKLTEIQKRAIEITKEIFNAADFDDLELLEGMGPKSLLPIIPPNGFDFIPSSLRVAPGETEILPLRVSVPRKLRNGSVVNFSADSKDIEISPTKVVLDKSKANAHGVVNVKLEVTGKRRTSGPVTVLAKADSFVSMAMVRVAEHQVRGPVIRRESSPGIYYEEVAFEEGPAKHSRCISSTVQINTLNPDYKNVVSGNDEEKIAYASLLIAKEILVSNDNSGVVEDFLERFITFHFRLAAKLDE